MPIRLEDPHQSTGMLPRSGMRPRIFALAAIAFLLPALLCLYLLLRPGEASGLNAGGFTLAVISLGTLVIIWLVGDRLIAKPFDALAAALEARNEALDRQRTELAETAARLSATIDAVPIAVISLDTSYNVVTWSRGAERTFGYTRAETVDRPYPLIPPGGKEEFDQLTARVMKQGERVRDITVRRRHKDGRVLDVLFSGAPLYDAQRRIVGAVYGLEDVTERKKAEEAQILNQRIFATSLDLILVTDRQGNFILASPSAEPLLGYRPEEMIGRSGKDFIHPDDLDSTRDEMRQGRRRGTLRNFECRYLRKNSDEAVTLTWTGVWSEGEQRHFFIGRDVTEVRKREQQLVQAQKMETVGQLTGGLAHDFNNLLGIVIGNLELIQDTLTKDHAAWPLVDVALEACLRGAQLNRSLLAFSRRQELRPQRADPSAAVRGMARMLQRILGEHIQIEAITASSVWPVRVDLAQLESAILNLAVNARDAMPDGGRLVLETANVVLDEAYAAEHAEVTPGAYVLIAISDSGTGMTAETLARVFEPFFTTKEVGKGSGLGLSMVHGFIKQSRGHVKVYSEPGRGTTVRLYLPRDRADSERGEALHGGEETKAVGSETVLIVEDNPALRRVAASKLVKLGYRTLEAANAAEALDILDHGAKPDLLFSDVVMPGPLDGVALAQEAVQRRPSLRVLLTSGFTERAATPSSGRPIPWPLLSKPYRNSELADALRAALARPPAGSAAAD